MTITAATARTDRTAASATFRNHAFPVPPSAFPGAPAFDRIDEATTARPVRGTTAASGPRSPTMPAPPDGDQPSPPAQQLRVLLADRLAPLLLHQPFDRRPVERIRAQQVAIPLHLLAPGERLQERLDEAKSRWKFNPDDLDDRKLWKD